MVGGVSEGLFLQHCWKFLCGEECKMICRSDSSAARALASRLGIGRTRHIAANLLWLQQKVKEKTVQSTAIPTELNPADVGTKSLSKARLTGLKYVMKMVNHVDERIGEKEFEEIEANRKLKKEVRHQVTHAGSSAKVAMVVALSLLGAGRGEYVREGTFPLEATNGTNIEDAGWNVNILFLFC